MFNPVDSFFDLSKVEQAHQVLMTHDPKFLQVMLGPKFCLVQEDWLSHCLFAHKFLVSTQRVKQQLLRNFVWAQIKVLSDQMPSSYRPLPSLKDVADERDPESALKDWQKKILNYRATSQDVAEVNAALQRAEEKVMSVYSTGSYTANLFFNPIKNSFTGENVSNVVCVRKDIASVLKANENKALFKPVLELNLQDYYDALYQEACNDLKRNHSYRIKEGQNIYSLYEKQTLQNKLSDLSKNSDRFDSIITATCDMIHSIHNNEFVDKVFDKLIDMVLDKASEDAEHPIYSDIKTLQKNEVKKLIKMNWKELDKSDILHTYLEVVILPLPGQHINLDLLHILLVNGASLFHPVMNQRTGKFSPVKDLLVAKKGEYQNFVSTSIFTITKRAQDLVFNFPFEKNNLDMLRVVSLIPSEEGHYDAPGAKMLLLFKSGKEGEKQFMNLILDCIRKTKNSKVSAIDKFINFFTRCSVPSEEERDRALKKLYEIVSVGHLAIRTGSNLVLLDYLRDIKLEMEHNTNGHLRKLYRSFHDILYDYQELPKKMFLVRWARYVSRTLNWTPAWEKIIRNPGYDDEASEWSHERHKDIANWEREEKQRERQQLETENQRMFNRLQNESRESRLADFKSQANSDLNCQFTIKTRDLDMEFLLVVAQSQAAVIRAILDFSVVNEISPELVLDIVLREITDSRQEVIESNSVAENVLDRAFESVILNITMMLSA